MRPRLPLWHTVTVLKRFAVSGSTKLYPLEWAPFQTARSTVHWDFIWGSHPFVCMCVSVCGGGYMWGSLPSSVDAEGVLVTWLNHVYRTAPKRWLSVSVIVQRRENDIYMHKCLLPKVISLLPYLLSINALCKSAYFMCMSYRPVIHDMTGAEGWTKKKMDV